MDVLLGGEKDHPAQSTRRNISDSLNLQKIYLARIADAGMIISVLIWLTSNWLRSFRDRGYFSWWHECCLRGECVRSFCYCCLFFEDFADVGRTSPHGSAEEFLSGIFCSVAL